MSVIKWDFVITYTASLSAGIGAGPWTIGTGVNPRNIDLAIDAIGDQVRQLRADGVTADELAHAQDFMTGSRCVWKQTMVLQARSRTWECLRFGHGLYCPVCGPFSRRDARTNSGGGAEICTLG